jgi:hypothetical protein
MEDDEDDVVVRLGGEFPQIYTTTFIPENQGSRVNFVTLWASEDQAGRGGATPLFVGITAADPLFSRPASTWSISNDGSWSRICAGQAHQLSPG